LDQVVVTSAGSELERRVAASGVVVVPARWRAGLDPRVLPSILRQLRSGAILHAHDAHALTLAGLASWLSGSPLVATRRVIFPLRNRLFWRRACRIIAISSAVRDALIRDGLSPERLALIPSAVELPGSGPGGINVRTHLGLPSRGHLVVSLGALTPEKDQATLISAAAGLVQDLPDLHWVIAGEGPMRTALEQQIRQSGLTGRVHLWGDLDDPHQVLDGADLFVLSSASEGLGSSVLAAMARGVPVVATSAGGIPDLLGSGSGVMVEPGNSTALGSAVRRVLGNPDLQQQLTSRAREQLGRFSVDAVAEQVVSVYRSCAHSLDGS
jgi:glycosyltransferase involved in cell wall biosynthesis